MRPVGQERSLAELTSHPYPHMEVAFKTTYSYLDTLPEERELIDAVYEIRKLVRVWVARRLQRGTMSPTPLYG